MADFSWWNKIQTEINQTNTAMQNFVDKINDPELKKQIGEVLDELVEMVQEARPASGKVSAAPSGSSRRGSAGNADDADRHGLRDGTPATVSSRVGSVSAPVEVTDAIRPGVVSLPHGWGHGQPGTRMAVAAEYAGVNSNVLADDQALDPLSGTSVLNGIPVTVEPTDDVATS